MDGLEVTTAIDDSILTCPHVDPLNENSIAGSVEVPGIGTKYLCNRCLEQAELLNS